MTITLMAISLMFVVCQIIKLITDVYEMSVCNYFKIADEGIMIKSVPVPTQLMFLQAWEICFVVSIQPLIFCFT